MKTKQSKEQIESEITKKREMMITSAKLNGYTNDTTLKYSQELDILIYEYLRFFRKKEIVNIPVYTKRISRKPIQHKVFA